MRLAAEFLLVSIISGWDTNPVEADSTTSEPAVVTAGLSQDSSTLVTDLKLVQPNVDISKQQFKDSCQVGQDELKECRQQVNNLMSAHFEQTNNIHKYLERLLQYNSLEISNCKNDTAFLSKELEYFKMKLQELSADASEVNTKSKTKARGKQTFSKGLCERGASEENLNKGLVYATTAGNLSLVSNCLNYGAHPNSTVHLAAQYGHSEIVELLLVRGADVDLERKDDKWTPLHVAVQHERLNVVRLLLSKGAETGARRDDKCTALYQASSLGNLQIVQTLLQFNASLELRCENGSMPLLVAAKKNHVDVTSILLEHGADVNGRDNNNQTALYLAARRGNEEIVKLLIKHGAKVDLTRMDGRSALYAASELNHTQIAKTLLKAGADPNILSGPFSRTPLYMSTWKGNEEVAKLLIKHKANVSAETKYGWTALHVASEYNHLGIAKALLEAGANGNVRGGQSLTTPLYMATMNGNEKIVKLLIQHKANVSLPTIYGWTALHDAAERNQMQIAEDLLDAGADVNVKHPDNGFTPLHSAALYSSLEMVKLLVNKGAKVKEYSLHEFKTPRDYAAARGHKQIEEYLASVGG